MKWIVSLVASLVILQGAPPDMERQVYSVDTMTLNWTRMSFPSLSKATPILICSALRTSHIFALPI